MIYGKPLQVSPTLTVMLINIERDIDNSNRAYYCPAPSGPQAQRARPGLPSKKGKGRS